MKVSPVNYQNYSCFKRTLKQNNPQPPVEQPAKLSFKGGKGAAIGAGAGLLWSAAILGICAVAAPYVLPVIAADALIGGAGVGALAGHCMEKENKA